MWTVSNPYRGASPPPNTLTTYAYDSLGRRTSVTNPDSSVTSTSYTNNSSTVVDAAGKTRTLVSDALGRLTSVTEDPGGLGYVTSYTYNALDNLLTVSQSGQSRSFSYDSLSRLSTATNPENGQVEYGYDGVGNVTSKTDARGTTTYTYDPLNRLLTKSYTDPSTVRACYAYDGLGWTGSGDTMGYSIGHLTGSWSVQHDGGAVAASQSSQFDAMGRLQAGWQCTPGTCGVSSYSVAAGYNLKGDETSFSDSATTRSTTYDAADRLLTLQATLPGLGNTNLLNVTSYSPVGLQQATLGNNLTEKRGYTNRNWLGYITVQSGSNSPIYSLKGSCTATDGNPAICYAGNGNVLSANDLENHNWTYSLYDGVNRLKTATNNTTNQTFSYNFDAWGNMTCSYSQGPGTCPALSYDPNTNRISDGIHQYDNNVAGGPGNMTADGTHGYVYDAENRITCVVGTDGTCTSANATLYFYDPDGRRVGKQQADTLEDYVYDPQGHVSSVHDGGGNLLRSELYSPDGRHTATWNSNGLFWNHADWLGTERVRTNSSGTPIEWCTDTPYGMNLTCTPPPDQSPMHFTGKQRDAESGLDNFGARYFGGGNNLGRFMTADPGPWIFQNPQSYNAYVYALNNPLHYADDGGETAQDRVNEANYLATQNIPYASGGTDPANGLDCRGLVQVAFKADPDNTILGIDTAGNAAIQASLLQKQGYFSPDIGNAQPGDAIFFANTNGTIAHTGIVVRVKDGTVYFVHAPHTGTKVREGSISIKAIVWGSQTPAGIGRPNEPGNHLSPTSQQSHNNSSAGFLNWVETLFFNQAPPSPSPTSPKTHVTSFLCGGTGDPPCDR